MCENTSANAVTLERLGRGVIVLDQGKGKVTLSWRLLELDENFNVYRSEAGSPAKLLNSVPLTGPTQFIDAQAPMAKQVTYSVRAVRGGKEIPDERASFTLVPGEVEKPYLSFRLQPPSGGTIPTGETYTYSANDASVADLDGDGEYEIILKWDPSNAHDNAQKGYTGNVYLDAYKLNGTRLWRIDLGRNIRAGAHYTQIIAYDLDGDRKAEIACKTADGTVDGAGKTNGDANADYRNTGGYILAGPEYFTIFNGVTGAALFTTKYDPPRAATETPTSDELKKIWGDGYGNRLDRYNACVAYLDGVHPSLVLCRGYYTRTVLVAWDWLDGKLTQRWKFDSNTEGNAAYGGQGNHNLSVADVDGDGKDEIVYGACVIDDNGKGLYSTGFGHGDAQHVGDLDPTNPGLEVFGIQERFDDAGQHLFDAKTGKVLWKKPSVKAGADGEGPGRGLAIDIDPRHRGAECWAYGAGATGLLDARGQTISEKQPNSCNFGIYWDGDLLRELLDGNKISKWEWETSSTNLIFKMPGCSSNNGSKKTVCLSGDILGDWREEVMIRTDDSSELRIYSSTIPTLYRLVTLVQDRQYRLSIVWQNVGYNQPPHTSFSLESKAVK